MDVLRQMSYEPVPVHMGYTDRILRVDLTTRTIEVQALPPDFKEKWTGGRGYALKLIWDGTSADTRYDSPENLLVMASGPLGNEPGFPGTGKFIVGTISPLTATFIDSNVGGHFGPLLKLAGFDALAVCGTSDEELILVVDGDTGSVSLSPAPVYEGAADRGGISYGERLLREMDGGEFDGNTAAVTAGWAARHSRFGIVNSLYFDRRRNRIRAKQAGRGGTGTVMRAKGLRAIVARSSLPRGNGNNAANRGAVREAGARLKRVVRKFDPQQLHLSAWGTTALSEFMDRFHLLPVNNFQYGQSPRSPELFAQVFLDRYFTQKVPDGCYVGCDLACAKGAEGVELTRGPRAGARVGIDGPEYETVGAVSCMGIFDPHFVMEFNWYCDEYGIDTISTGVTIAFFMECAQRGFLTAEDVGYDLAFGDVEAASRLFHEIGAAEGFGKVAGQGVAAGKEWVAARHAARTGTAKEAVLAEVSRFGMEVKGLEFSLYVSKESLAQQGGYGFALKGPQHDEAWLIFIDQVHGELPTFERKAKALRWFPLVRTWFNATGLCKLPWIDVRHPDAKDTEDPAKNLPSLGYYVDYLNATTGSRKTLEDVLADSERLHVLQKLINLRQGKGTRANDRIPPRAMGPAFLNEYEARADHYDRWLAEHAGGVSLPADAEARRRLLMEKREEAFERLCDVVYEEKGLDSRGIPTRETVARFGLLDEQAEQLLACFGAVPGAEVLSKACA